VQYTVTAINVIAKNVKIENEEDTKFLDFEDFKKQTNFKVRRDNDKK